MQGKTSLSTFASQHKTELRTGIDYLIVVDWLHGIQYSTDTDVTIYINNDDRQRWKEKSHNSFIPASPEVKEILSEIFRVSFYQSNKDVTMYNKFLEATTKAT